MNTETKKQGSVALGKRIRELRTARKAKDPKFAQIPFSSAVGISQTFLSKIESGDLPPSAEKIKKIAELLEVDADELLSLAEKIDPELTPVFKQPVVPAFLRTIQGLSSEKIQEIVGGAIEKAKEARKESADG